MKFFHFKYGGSSRDSASDELLLVMSKCISDFDWETRENCRYYWRDVAMRNEPPESFARFLEESWCATALSYAMVDCGLRFKFLLLPVINHLRLKLLPLYENKNPLLTDLPSVTQMCKISSENLAARIREFNFSEPSLLMHEDLWSIVRDISSAANCDEQNVVDCF